MSQKTFLFSLLALFTGVALVQASPPNVILIYVDDLGYGDLSSHHHPVLKTPHLDRLASESLELTNYYAPSALCSPSRASLLTGRMPYRTGIESWIPHGTDIYLRDEEITLAELLNAEGYRTALVGKWHLNSDLGDSSEPQPNSQGFEYAYGHNAFQIPNNHNPTNIYENGKLLPEQQGYTAQLYVDKALGWIEERETEGAPYFLYLAMAEPHTAIANPPEYNAMYSNYTHGEIVPARSGLGHPDLQPARGPGEYYANITYLDAQLGRLLEEMDRRGWSENTLLVFSSDNGPVTSAWRAWHEINSYGETGGYRGRKHWLYEGGLRVPAFIRLPGVITPGKSETVTVGMDLFTTIAHLCGASVPTDRAIDGVDLTPLFEGKQINRPTPLIWALPTDDGKDFAIRDGDWKLLLDEQMKPIELYDLNSDPTELVNLLEKKTDVASRLKAAFDRDFAEILSDPLRPKRG